MSTATKPTRKAATPAVSTTVAKLLAQVQAEAQQTLLVELSAKDGITVLKPLELTARDIRTFSDFDCYNDRNGAEVCLMRNRQWPECWGPHMRPGWHPSYYLIDVTRVDGQGVAWKCQLGPHMVDDFGTLVSAKGGAA